MSSSNPLMPICNPLMSNYNHFSIIVSIDMVIENNELRLLPPPPGGSKGFAGAARPVSSKGTGRENA